MDLLEELLVLEELWRGRIAAEQQSSFYLQIVRPLSAFRLLCLQATNSEHCPTSEPSLRREIIAHERSVRLRFAVRFISLRVQWEEMWGRLALVSSDALVRRLWMPTRHVIALEEAAAWRDIIFAAEPFLEDVAEERGVCERARADRQQRLQWLEALRERELASRRELLAYRREVTAVGKAMSLEGSLLPHASSPVAARTAASYSERLRMAEASLWEGRGLQ